MREKDRTKSEKEKWSDKMLMVVCKSVTKIANKMWKNGTFATTAAPVDDDDGDDDATAVVAVVLCSCVGMYVAESEHEM